MNLQPLTLALFWGLAIVCAAAAWLAWSATRRAALQRAEAVATQARLEQQLAEQRSATERAELARTRAEAELRDNEQAYVMALRGSQDGLWEWDISAGTVQLSPRWKSMLGFATLELGTDLADWHSRVHADDQPAFDRALKQYIRQARTVGADERFDHEMRLQHKDGSIRWVLSRGVAIRRADGEPYRMIGMDTDITRIKQVLAVLDAVAAGTADAFGDRYFPAMVQHFARALGVDRAFVTECADYPTTRVRTLAYWCGDGLRENIEYALEGTPCEAVVKGQQVCFHRNGVAEKYPREAGWEAFLGLPIIASDGRLLGHLAFFSSRPLGDEVLVDSVYRIFLARTAAEMERLQALARLDAAVRCAAAGT